MSKRQPPHDQAKAARLTWRDRAIMNHVLRYRLTTVNVVERAVLQQHSRNAVTKGINGLCESHHLLRQTLVHPLRYYILGPAGYAALGARVPRQATLGPQALPSEYAVLLYSLCGNQQRGRLLASEVRESHPWMSDQLLRAVHCQDFEKNVLELYQVNAHRVELAERPLATWSPSRPTPNAERIADKTQNRWRGVCVVVTVCVASQRTANVFGSTAYGLPRPEQLDHDLWLSAVYLRYRTNKPRRGNTWVGEHCLPKSRLSHQGSRCVPD